MYMPKTLYLIATTSNGVEYIKFTKLAPSWYSARSVCQEFGLQLATFNNVSEIYAIDGLRDGDEYWIGLYRDPWFWRSGITQDYNNIFAFTLKNWNMLIF